MVDPGRDAFLLKLTLAFLSMRLQGSEKSALRLISG